MEMLVKMAEVLVKIAEAPARGAAVGGEAGVDLSAGDGAVYARVTVEEDDVVLLGEIARCGGDVAAACSTDGTTPLHRAVLDGNARMVRVLLEHGADPDRGTPVG
ncbi:hypothetical protein VPH35_038258 [Triticum aestivum]